MPKWCEPSSRKRKMPSRRLRAGSHDVEVGVGNDYGIRSCLNQIIEVCRGGRQLDRLHCDCSSQQASATGRRQRISPQSQAGPGIGRCRGTSCRVVRDLSTLTHDLRNTVSQFKLLHPPLTASRMASPRSNAHLGLGSSAAQGLSCSRRGTVLDLLLCAPEQRP